MGWQRADDQGAYDVARELQRHTGTRWVVFWGPASRRFWAFLRGGPHPLMLSDPSAQGLYHRIQQHQ